MMRALSSVFLAVLVLAALSPATADGGWSALAIVDLNLREGPGADYPAVGMISRHSHILVHSCGYHRHWCSITHKAKTGFVSRRYLVRLGKPQRPSLDKPDRRFRLFQAMIGHSEPARSRAPLDRRRAVRSDHDLHVPWQFGSRFQRKRFGYPLYGYSHYGYRPYGYERHGYRHYGYR